ncbi:hypothetical protein Mal52_19670 [Symmachiella dynata]|uniref:Uncharacterized protein n=1 Tax=Symmachiella dynata TaxID=2527995 RepID=A0A517ZLZ0_9PLAN|nr:hypothetical protein Mal52_19670 [Symmachiella dynata]
MASTCPPHGPHNVSTEDTGEARLIVFLISSQQTAFRCEEAIIGWQRLPTAIGVPQAQDAAVSTLLANRLYSFQSGEIAASCGLRPPRLLPQSRLP